ncbi:AAA-type ATPase lid domain-containing protein [Bradyrhizobium sp. JR3.5]
MKEFGNSMGKPIEEIVEESMSALRDYHWPGNIRELRNVIERAMILSHGPKLYIKLSNATLRPVAVKITAGSLDEAELTIIRQAVEQCNWRIRGANGAAALLKMKPTTLESRIKDSGSHRGVDLRSFGDSPKSRRAGARRLHRIRSAV